MYVPLCERQQTASTAGVCVCVDVHVCAGGQMPVALVGQRPTSKQHDVDIVHNVVTIFDSFGVEKMHVELYPSS